MSQPPAGGVTRRGFLHMLGAVGETVMGASVIRAHGIEARTAERIDTTVLATRGAQVKAQRLSMAVSPFAEIVAAIANAVTLAIVLTAYIIGETNS